MIEWVNSEHGPLPRRSGLQLCSRKDPKKEAQSWLKNLLDRKLPIAEDKHVIILGAGGGFHIEAIARAFPKLKISVVDVSNSLISELAPKLERFGDRIDWIQASDKSTDWMAQNSEKILSSRILIFRPSWQGAGESFTKIHRSMMEKQWQQCPSVEIKNLLGSVVQCG